MQAGRIGIGIGTAVVVLALLAGGALGGFTGTIGDTNVASSGSLALSDEVPSVAGVTCSDNEASGAPATCPANLLNSGSIASSVSLAVKLTNLGTSPASVNVSASNIGAAQVADETAGGDTGLSYQGVTYLQPGALGGGFGLGFNGGGSVVNTIETITDPLDFTAIIWFKTSSSGAIFGFSNAYPNSGQTDADRMMWINAAGNLVVAINDAGTNREVTSNAAGYDNGAWHMAALISSVAGLSLKVDAVALKTTAAYTAPQNYSGYWHAGWAAANSWTTPPTSNFLNGDLAGFAIVPGAMTNAHLNTLHTEATWAAYDTAVEAYAPTQFWPMQDAGTTLYTGAVPGASSATTTPDVSGNGNAGTIEGGVTNLTTGPVGGESDAFNGTTGWVQTVSRYTNPQTFTETAWFNTVGSGTILSFEDMQGNTGISDWDRMIWVDPAGHLVAGVRPPPGAMDELVSTNTYNNGAWHLVTVTLSIAGWYMYVDGSLQASSGTVTAAQIYNGWWHIGWSNADAGWPDSPTSDFFPGDLAGVGVLSTALTGPEAVALHSSATFVGYSAGVMSYSPVSYWPMQDSSVASLVDLTLQLLSGATTSCLWPLGVGACPAPSGSYTLGGLSQAESGSFTLTSGASATLTVTELQTVPTYPSAVGLQVLCQMNVNGAESSWAVALQHPDSGSIL
jgi:hypothetical protein